MLKKIIGISAIALLAAGAAACSGGNGTDTEVVSDATEVSEIAGEADTSGEAARGDLIELPDISADMAAKGAKVDISAEVSKYKPLVTLANYKGVKVTKGEVYAMTDEEVEEELDMMLVSFKKFEDVTANGTTQSGDTLTITTDTTIDGQPYEDYTVQDQYYELGSELISEEFDKQLTGKKANEDFEIKITFPDDYIPEEYLEEGEMSLNGKTAVFKTKITKIERPTEETMNDEWVKNHKEDLADYYPGGVNTVEELKSLIKKETDEYSVKSLIRDRGNEAKTNVIAESKFSSYPEDELNTLKEQTKLNIQQEYETYKEMSGVDSLEQYLEMVYEIKGENALEEYATQQAQQYLQNKMIVVLIADAEGIEIGEDDVKEMGDDLAAMYELDSFEELQKQYGDDVRQSVIFEALYNKVITYLGSVSDPSLEPEVMDDSTIEFESEAETVSE